MAQITTEPPKRELKTFASFLMEARKGGLHTELSEQLADLVTQVVATGKKGTIKLTLTVAPSKDDEAIVVVTDGLSVATPKHTQRPTLFYPDEAGNLHRRDPRQAEIPGMGLRGVPGGTGDQADDEVKAGAS